MKYITPIILLIISITSFLMFTNPTYNEIGGLKTLANSYNDALNNAAELQTERDALTTKYNNISADNTTRLTQFLPDNVDNIRLIIDLQRMGQAYGMTVSSTKFDAKTTQKSAAVVSTSPTAAAGPSDVALATQDYGSFDLELSTTGSYDNFLKFLKDVESSLRLTDIESISFSSEAVLQQAPGTAPLGLNAAASPASTSSVYTYTIKLRTYWLKG